MTKVFIEGATQALRLVEPPYDVLIQQYKTALAIEGGPTVVEGTGPHGAPVAFPAARVIDIVGDRPEPEVKINPGVFYGRQVTLRDYDTWREAAPQDGGPDPFERWDAFDGPAVVVLGEDLGETAVLVATPTGEPLWVNPASPVGGLARYAQVVRLAVEAESILQPEHKPTEPMGEPAGGDDLSNEDAAQAHLEKGDVPAAVAIAGSAYVAAFLEGSLSMGEVFATTKDGRALKVVGQGHDAAEIQAEVDGTPGRVDLPVSILRTVELPI